CARGRDSWPSYYFDYW
nr:immunoglobulin heavy chain junction region [Macaca mulatta]